MFFSALAGTNRSRDGYFSPCEFVSEGYQHFMEGGMRAPNRGVGPGSSVDVDWHGELPKAQQHAFETYIKEFEGSYLMFSISLDEAISLHQGTWLSKSFQVAALTSELCAGLTASLENMLRSLSEHCREQGTNPAVAPLNPADFSNVWAKLVASSSLIWHSALPTRRAQFQNKIRSLRSMIRHAKQDFCTVAETLASEGIEVDLSASWAVMNRTHFDLNTCLRESFILLKCFMRVLPGIELRAFQEKVSKGLRSARAHFI
jgi:hypothetical protein